MQKPMSTMEEQKLLLEKNLKNFSKTLDKYHKVWYNINVNKESRYSINKRRKGNDTMANAKKMTKRDYFNTLLNMTDVKSNPKLVEFIEHELELLDRKNSTDKKPTAQQTANEGIKTAILDNMAEGAKYTITDLIKSVPECADLTNQRVSALMRQLIEAKLVVRTEDKRKAYFSLA